MSGFTVRKRSDYASILSTDSTDCIEQFQAVVVVAACAYLARTWCGFSENSGLDIDEKS